VPQLHVTWLTAGILATVLIGVGGLVSLQLRRGRAGAAIREVGIVLGLFGLWMLVGRLFGHHPGGGYARGADIWSMEQWLHIDNEATLQRPLLGHHWMLVASNYYYAYAHWLSVDVVLAWLWLRHSAHYVVARTALVLFTGACLLLHLVSTAPPRLLGQTHLIDTAALLGQSVYGDTPGISDHLSAMPSIHVGWAVLFAAVAWRTRSRVAKILLTGHALATSYVVVVTGNHFWLDGAVAAVMVAAVVPAAAWLCRMRLPAVAGVADFPTSGLGQRRPVAKGSV
jgi:hypothetical protein